MNRDLQSTDLLPQGNVFTPVYHSVHRGVSVSGHGGLLHPPGQTPPRAENPWADPPGRHPLRRHPLRSACWDTVNKRSVRILLECILVAPNLGKICSFSYIIHTNHTYIKRSSSLLFQFVLSHFHILTDILSKCLKLPRYHPSESDFLFPQM